MGNGQMPFGDEFDCAEEPATAVRDSTGRCQSRQRMECASAALALSEFAFAFSALFGSTWEWAQFPKSGGKPRALQTLARLRTHGSDAMTGSQCPGVEGPNDNAEVQLASRARLNRGR